MGASMVKIESKSENDLLIDMHKKVNKENVYYWLGGRTVFVGDSTFEWADNTPIVYKNWMKGEPNNVDLKTGACINIFTETGYWHDYYCVGYPHMRQLCEKKIVSIMFM
ncbi:low affinity immunoglobulin epsilon Fc receptor-like isoform X1 [Leptotrombidium deliense]|uniref:Low affinity immunoglobulin epsilon Fc receptor-like isoform X1 n=1 Tax=Leptotrombidium deliense TaxID=299467 RepID=A0A443RY34_9ACAR|nr:low affinity immunoglobulin epsilon Fc receptor-like isoform X1 [Leptotrombidium deliense]